MSQLFKSRRASSKAFIAALVCATALVAPAHAATISWQGGSPDQSWSNPDNWVGGVVPSNGDNVLLPDGTGQSISLANALGVEAGSIRVESTGFSFYSGTLAVSGPEAITVGRNADVEIDDLGAAGAASFDSSSTLDLTGFAVVDVTIGSNLTIGGTIKAPDGFEKTGEGSMSVNGSVDGAMTVTDGTLTLGYQGTTTADVTGRVTIDAKGTVSVSTITGAPVSIGSLDGPGRLLLTTDLNSGRDGTDSTFSGDSSGNGTFHKQGAGKQTFTGSMGNTGGIDIQAGTVSVGDGGTTGTVAGPIVVGEDAALWIDRSSDVELASPISGVGEILKLGKGTATLSGINSFSGTTTIVDGGLLVDGSIAGSVTVGQLLERARIVREPQTPFLGGVGTLENGTINDGGAVSPGKGDGIATLTFNERLLFSSGSFYDLDVDASGSSDLLIATNLVLEGGTVRVRPIAGTYADETIYNIAQADTISGEFDGTSLTDLAFLDASLIYDANWIDLKLTRKTVVDPVDPTDPIDPVEPTDPVDPTDPTGPVDPTAPVAFNTAAATDNQFRAADGIESTGGGALFENVMVQTSEGARQAFDAVSGESHPSQQTALLENATAISGTALDRAGVGSNARSNGGAVMSYVDDAEGGRALSAGDLNAWAAGYGNVGSIDGNGNAASLETRSGGFQAGADDWFGDFRLGAMLSAGRSFTSVPARASSSESNDYGVAIYGGTDIEGTGIALGASYTRSDIDTSRTVAFPGFVETVTGSYSANTTQVFGEINQGFEVGNGVEIEPFARAAYVHVGTDGFTEQGGSSALTVDADSAHALFTTLGVRASAEFVLENDMTVSLDGGIGWRHAFADDPSSSVALAGGNRFSATGIGMTRDALVVEAGLGFEVSEGATFTVSYDGQFSGSSNDHAVRAKFAVKF